jgi:hypothetical protein
MTRIERILRFALQKAGATEHEGEHRLPDDKLLTLYAGHEGTSLTVQKVAKVRVEEGLIEATSAKGELFLVAIDDLFAVSVAGTAQSPSSRQAGFLG